MTDKKEDKLIGRRASDVCGNLEAKKKAAERKRKLEEERMFKDMER